MVYKKLAALNGMKATGVDNIPPRLVKADAAQLSEPIATLFNMSVTQAVFPDMLKRADVWHLFKKGDVSNVCNYRPVSILLCLSKIFEGILIDRLHSYLNRSCVHKYQVLGKGSAVKRC